MALPFFEPYKQGVATTRRSDGTRYAGIDVDTDVADLPSPGRTPTDPVRRSRSGIAPRRRPSWRVSPQSVSTTSPSVTTCSTEGQRPGSWRWSRRANCRSPTSVSLRIGTT